MDRLLELHTSLPENPAASVFFERAVLLHHLGCDGPAIADLWHAVELDPTHPEAMALLCYLAALPGAAAKPVPGLHGLATRLLASPFATPDQRRRALPALDPAALPLVVQAALHATLRLTVVQREGEALGLRGAGPQDQIVALGQDLRQTEGQHSTIVACDCHFARPINGTRQVTLSPDAHPPLQVSIAANPLPTPLPATAGRPVAPVWIVLPLKDGGEALAQCLRSVRDELSSLPGARLVLVDDCSQLAATGQLLAEHAMRPGVQLIRTPRPLGFTGAVNLGLQEVGQGPVLLLNSDVWLPPGTLPRMLAHLADPEIGSVTPLSNNAGSVCLLGPGQAARMPDPEVCNRLAEAAWRLNPGISVEMPNGNGFALLLAADCLREIGPLSGLYESGYYEEVDFCLRASLRGWRHVAATDCFVGHIGSLTYGAEKARLVAANFRHLERRFPDYSASYRRFATLNPLARYANRLLAALAGDWTPVRQDDRPPAPRNGTFTWPKGLLVLPWQGAVAPAFLHHRFRRLRLVRDSALAAGGLTLWPGHGLVLRADATRPSRVSLHDGARRTPLAEFDASGASAADFADFEASLLDILAESGESNANHAVSV